jgi:hypothetical protein
VIRPGDLVGIALYQSARRQASATAHRGEKKNNRNLLFRKTKIKKSEFGKEMYSHLRKNAISLPEVARSTGVCTSTLYKACFEYKRPRPLSKFIIACVAQVLELSKEDLEKLHNLARNDRIRWDRRRRKGKS